MRRRRRRPRRSSPSRRASSQPRWKKSNDFVYACRACMGSTVRDATFDVLRELRPDDAVREPRFDRGPLPHRSCRTTCGSCSGSTRPRSSAWRRAWRSGGTSPRSRSCTRRRASATLSARSRPRASTGHRSSSLVGQQDRRHLALEPFLAGTGCDGLAGDYPVWVDQPVRPQDVPGAIARAVPRGVDAPRACARDRADGRLGADAGERRRARRAGRVVRAAAVGAGGRRARRAAPRRRIAGARRRRGCRRRRHLGCAGGARGATRRCPVWQEPFSARAGFPQDHRLFAGHLPADRPRLRATLAPYDLVLVVGGPVLRQYPYVAGPSRRRRDTQFAVVSRTRRRRIAAPPIWRCWRARPRSCAELAHACWRDARRRRLRVRAVRPRLRRLPPASRCAPLTCCAALAERMPRNASRSSRSRPSNRPELLARMPAREPLGSLSPAMGGLGFALPAAIGLRHGAARPAGRRDRRRRLVAVRDPGALERGAVRRGRAVRDPLRTAATRSWTGSPSSRAARPLADLRRRRRRARAGVRLPGAHDRRPRRRCCETFDEVLPGLGERAASRCCSRSRSRPTRRSRRDRRRFAGSLARAMRASRSRSRSAAISRTRGLRPGERLGTEQELAAEFGVSRPTLREGLRLLASSHLIRASRGPGGGIFVESTQSEGMSRNVSESIAAMLETDSVSLRRAASTRASRSRCRSPGSRRSTRPRRPAAELLAAIAEAEGNHPASEAFRVADTRFHRVIATAARNELLRAFTSWTLDVLQPSLIDTIGASIDGDAILRPAPRDPARDPAAPAGGRRARDAPPPRISSASSCCEPDAEGTTMKAALMREYHRPLELVDAAAARARAAERRARPDRRRRRLRDRPARDRGADGARRRDAAARARPRERGLGRGGRRRRHDGREGRRGARLSRRTAAGSASPCRRGNDMHCVRHEFTGLSVDGGFADYVLVTERSLLPLPAGVEPAAVAPHADAGLTAYHAVRRLAHLAAPGHDRRRDRRRRRRPHRAAAACASSARPASSPSTPTSGAGALAAELGADEVVDGAGAVDAVRELTGGRGADLVFDFVGTDADARRLARDARARRDVLGHRLRRQISVPSAALVVRRARGRRQPRRHLDRPLGAPAAARRRPGPPRDRDAPAGRGQRGARQAARRRDHRPRVLVP